MRVCTTVIAIFFPFCCLDAQLPAYGTAMSVLELLSTSTSRLAHTLNNPFLTLDSTHDFTQKPHPVIYEAILI